jgi:hypothetical protein
MAVAIVQTTCCNDRYTASEERPGSPLPAIVWFMVPRPWKLALCLTLAAIALSAEEGKWTPQQVLQLDPTWLKQLGLATAERLLEELTQPR